MSLRDPSSPMEWLRRAKSNLALAKSGRRDPDILREDLCFGAQQAVEKSLKAILLLKGIPFPRTHSVVALLSLLPDEFRAQTPELAGAEDLTVYAVEARYPGFSIEVSEEEYLECLATAERVVRWASALIQE